MDVKYMAYQLTAMASELSDAGWLVDVSQVELDDGTHVRTTATKGGVTVESLYVHNKEGRDEE